MTGTILTVGHSNHFLEHFLVLLKQHGIDTLCDVRSNPYSRMNPQFNREALERVLGKNGIAYVFLGQELGARSGDPSCYLHGKVQYSRLAQTALFRKGIDDLRERMRAHRVAVMCAEKDPLECHRTVLISRYLCSIGITVEHILPDGSLENHGQTVTRLLHQLDLQECDLFRSREDVIEDAYRIQGERIAYTVSIPSGEAEQIRRNTR
jgi:uncharacterized protein (DUF488 family)